MNELEQYKGNLYTIEEVMEVVCKDKPFYDSSGGGLTLTGGEVLQQHEFATALAKEAKRQGIHVAIETSGYAKSEIFLEFIKNIDLLLYDIKHPNDTAHRRFTGVGNELILHNLKLASDSGVPVTVRVPVIPTVNHSCEDAKKLSTMLLDTGIKEVHLLPFHQFGEKKQEVFDKDYLFKDTKQLYPEDLEEMREIIHAHGVECRII